MESDHTPAAFSPPTTQGEDNLTQPKGSGEQPTSVEATLFAIEDYIGGNVEGVETVDRMGLTLFLRGELNNLVAEERRQAKIELAEKLNALPDVPMPKGSHVSAIFRTAITNELTSLRGENNE